ncbi:uncharacterized protein N7483_012318 [Penicillium malachiteum]|uniref:uncharacterized protein n=1 Tax=Penicillium malachiteum TaxID=1324776 RepID=UPI0025475579|nr:uncharacterized protein N7483_012318 [Penicillium malachiteum]KAJ5715137.1 hypothetical protein N7483_012318 [Penicillium malachiteum]
MSSTTSDGSRQPGLIVCCVIMLILAVTSVALRCWSIWGSRTHRFGFDDAFAIITLDACITFPKLSVLCFYHRVFKRGGTWVRPVLWVVGALCVGWLIGSWFATVFQCTPVRASWETVAGSTCVKQWKFFTGTAVPNGILDVTILIIPLPLLWSLQMTRPKKFMLTGMSICGHSVVVVSIGRLITLLKAGSSLESDLTWSTIDYICWVQCEGPVSLMSVCLPNIMELGRRLRQQWTKNTTGRSFSLSATKKTASDLLGGKQSLYSLEDDRETILKGHRSGTPSVYHINTTTSFEVTRLGSVSEWNSTV